MKPMAASSLSTSTGDVSKTNASAEGPADERQEL